MKHRVVTRTLGRQTAHRQAMLRNMAKSLLSHGRITTTQTRAKELSKLIDELITWAKEAKAAEDKSPAQLAAKRQVFRLIPGAPRTSGARSRPDRDVAQTLFDQLAPRYADRPGGFTRIIKLYPRKGDGAPMALIELIEPEAKK